MTTYDTTKIIHAASCAGRVAKDTAKDFARARALAGEGRVDEAAALLAVLLDQIDAARDAIMFAGVVPASRAPSA